MCVRILLQKHVGTLPRAIVGLVLLWRDDPIPSKLFEVHCQGISTATLLLRRFVAVQADSAFRPVFPAVRCIQFNKWNLYKTEIIPLIEGNCPDTRQNCDVTDVTCRRTSVTSRLGLFNDTVSTTQSRNSACYNDYKEVALHYRQASKWRCSQLDTFSTGCVQQHLTL